MRETMRPLSVRAMARGLCPSNSRWPHIACVMCGHLCKVDSGGGDQVHRKWVKEWRKETNSGIWDMPPLYFKIWRWLLMAVDHETGTWPGALSQIAKGVQWRENKRTVTPSKSTILRVLNTLEDKKMIKRTKRTAERSQTHISVINWNIYQGKESNHRTGEPQNDRRTQPQNDRRTQEEEEKQQLASNLGRTAERQKSGTAEQLQEVQEKSSKELLRNSSVFDGPVDEKKEANAILKKIAQETGFFAEFKKPEQFYSWVGKLMNTFDIEATVEGFRIFYASDKTVEWVREEKNMKPKGYLHTMVKGIYEEMQEKKAAEEKSRPIRGDAALHIVDQMDKPITDPKKRLWEVLHYRKRFDRDLDKDPDQGHDFTLPDEVVQEGIAREMV